MLKHQLQGIGFSRRDFFAVFSLVFNVFTWYPMILILIEAAPQYTGITSAIFTTFYVAAIGSSIAGSFFSLQIKRSHFLAFWMIIGALSSILPVFVNNPNGAQLTLIFLLLGMSLGLGMPSCLAFLADLTNIENRGRASALIFSAANLSILPLALVVTTTSLATSFLFLTFWRGLGLLIFLLLKPQEESSQERSQKASFTTVFQNRSFTLYLIAWVMFIFIDGFEKSILGDFLVSSFHRSIRIIQPIVASFAMLIAGFLSDRIGRKRVTIYGFVSLGIAYAVIGIAPTMQLSWFFYLTVDSIAAGVLWLVFILILWGDLSSSVAREQYYVTGNIPTLARNIIPLLPISFSALIPSYAAFSLASFFLFLAVLPLMYAPETLPEKKIRLRQLRGYAEAAKKAREKYLRRNGDS